MKKQKSESKKKEPVNNEKTAGDNQWTSTSMKYYPDDRDRRDGPGGD